MPSPVMPSWSLEDPETHEKDVFLGSHHKTFTGRRRFKTFNLFLSLFSCLALFTCVIYLSAPQYTSYSRTSQILETNITRDSSKSVVKKVTGYYGSGSWLDSSKTNSATQTWYLKSIALHKKHAAMHGHEQIISRKQLFGKMVDNAYTKIGNLMAQNFIEMNKRPEDAAKWLL